MKKLMLTNEINLKAAIYLDNCSSQNKNYVLVEFLYTPVHLGKFQFIRHRYPEPGHSFLPCDRSFEAIELQKRKYDKIFLRRDYINRYYK